jgi:hypothetical protein
MNHCVTPKSPQVAEFSHLQDFLVKVLVLEIVERINLTSQMLWIFTPKNFKAQAKCTGKFDKPNVPVNLTSQII